VIKGLVCPPVKRGKRCRVSFGAVVGRKYIAPPSTRRVLHPGLSLRADFIKGVIYCAGGGGSAAPFATFGLGVTHTTQRLRSRDKNII
jgi:hypothetical protein